MTTDRELLELAAKASGLPVEFDCEINGWFAHGRDKDGDVDRWWNPLTDDGDALRLAVKLGIALDKAVGRCWTFSAGMAIEGVCEEFYKDDPYAATRRAIVRAAAELGKAMP